MGRTPYPRAILELKGVKKTHPERLRVREHEPENINPVGTLPNIYQTLSKRYGRVS